MMHFVFVVSCLIMSVAGYMTMIIRVYSAPGLLRQHLLSHYCHVVKSGCMSPQKIWTHVMLEQQKCPIPFAHLTIKASACITIAAHHRTKVLRPLLQLYRGRALHVSAAVQGGRRPWLRALPSGCFLSHETCLVLFEFR